MTPALPVLRAASSLERAPSSLPALRSPSEVKVRLLQACDLRCGMCWHWQDPERGRKQLPKARVLELWSELAAMGVERVKLTGGEPTLRRDLEELVAGAKARGLAVTLATNAFRLSPERVDALVAAGVRGFHVSLDADHAALHDAIRGVDGAFEGTVATLRHLARAHGNTVKRVLSAVVQRRSIGALRGLVPLSAEHGLKSLYLLAVHTEPFCADDRPTLAQLRHYYFDELPAMLRAAAAAKVSLRPAPLFAALHGLPALRQAKALDEAHRDDGAFAQELEAFAQERYGAFVYARHACVDIAARAEIAETGEVYPCCHGEVPELSMGNIHDAPFARLWSGDGYRAFRAGGTATPAHPRCLTCKDAHDVTLAAARTRPD